MIPFVLKQASAHVCRLLKTLECKWTHAMFFRLQLEKGNLDQWVFVGGMEIQCIPKSTSSSRRTDLVLPPASKQCMLIKIGIILSIVREQGGRLK